MRRKQDKTSEVTHSEDICSTRMSDKIFSSGYETNSLGLGEPQKPVSLQHFTGD